MISATDTSRPAAHGGNRPLRARAREAFSPARLHRDQRGSISLLAVFTMLLLTMLLGQVINSVRQVDSKVRLQNAADAATYSGGVVLARGMNDLAFTNHLLCDIFAMTAFLREARDGNAASLVPEILDAWNAIAPSLSSSGFAKFEALGRVVPEKVRLEQQMVGAYSQWMQSVASMVLPVFEQILLEEMIPVYQRAVVEATPIQAQIATAEIALRHTRAPTREASRGPIAAVLWRTSGTPVGGADEMTLPTLPAIDPQSEAAYAYPWLRDSGRARRNQLAHRYLRSWNNQFMPPFDSQAKMSQFGRLWRGFTCGQLNRLLDENQERNLPMLIRPMVGDGVDGFTPVPGDYNNEIDRDYMFVGVTYWRAPIEIMPRVFDNPVESDPQAYAQGKLFIPRPRLVQWALSNDPQSILWPHWAWIAIQGHPTHWDLWNQNWSFQLVPATHAAVPTILSTDPSSTGLATLPNQSYRVPNLSALTPQQFQSVSSH